MTDNSSTGPTTPDSQSEKAMALLNAAIEPLRFWMSDDERSRLQFKFNDGSGHYGTSHLRAGQLDILTANDLVTVLSQAGVPVTSARKQMVLDGPVEFMAILPSKKIPAEGLDPKLPQKVRDIALSSPQLIPAIDQRLTQLNGMQGNVFVTDVIGGSQGLSWGCFLDMSGDPCFILEKKQASGAPERHGNDQTKMELLAGSYYKMRGILPQVEGDRENGYTLVIKGEAAKNILNPPPPNEDGPPRSGNTQQGWRRHIPWLRK